MYEHIETYLQILGIIILPFITIIFSIFNKLTLILHRLEQFDKTHEKLLKTDKTHLEYINDLHVKIIKLEKV